MLSSIFINNVDKEITRKRGNKEIIMKILHTSDWHLGINYHHHSFDQDQRYVLEQYYQLIQQEKIDVVLICGDIYDTTLASKEAIQLFDEAMQHMIQELKVKVIVIAGNHDSPTRLSVMSDLLKKQGLYIYGVLSEKLRPLTIDQVDFYPIPFVHKDTISALYHQSFTDYEQAFSLMMDHVRAQKNHHRQIVLAHAFVNGASVCEGDRFAQIGGADFISKDIFHDIDYVALGHLHRCQEIAKHIRYSGSLCPYTFGEVNPKKAVIIDSDTMEIQTVSVKPLHPMITLKGSYEAICLQLSEHQNDYVKIVLEDRGISFELLELLRERCPHLLTLSSEIQEHKESVSIKVDDLETLSDEAIVKQFFQDYFHRDITKEEANWLKEAKGCDTICG